MFTLKQKIKCLEREVAVRLAAYPKWVKQGRMKQAVAQFEIGVMSEILDDYRNQLREQEGNVPDEPVD